jgi:anti-sigma factor RsiW
MSSRDLREPSDRPSPVCRDAAPSIPAYVDGELEPGHHATVESHVDGCALCQERVQLHRATARTLREVSRRQLPQGADRAAMVARLSVALDAETRRIETRDVPRTPRTRSWAGVAAMGMAAAAVMAIGSRPTLRAALATRVSGFLPVQSTAAFDPIEGIVAMHSKPWPMERTDAQTVRQFGEYVGVPVRAPALEKSGARFVGGRLMPLHEERVALLEYRMGPGPNAPRMSVIIYDPRKVRVGQHDGFHPRTMPEGDVSVGQSNGLAVTLSERGGVAYAVASNLDEDQAVEMASLVARGD